MSGYYPPGVTGNEWQIAGTPETSEHVECTAEIVVAPTYLVTEAMEDLNKLVLRLRGMILADAPADKKLLEKHTLGIEIRLLKLKEELDTGMEAECNFEGDVDGQIRGGDLFVWTCPRCGTENEKDVDFGPDPDDYDDRED